MKIGGESYRTIWPMPQANAIQVIDQRLLPHEFRIVTLDNVEDVAAAIHDMTVRGAPLIGAAAAYGLALAMQHDLQGRLPWKKRLRRLIQSALAGRRWPATGDDEFFRKAVRRHELFWVRHL